MSDGRKGAAHAGASWREIAGSVLFFAGVTLWWLDPLPQTMEDHLPDHVAGEPLVFADLQLVVWALAWGARAIVTQPAAIFDANIFYPMPESLAFSEHFFGLLPLFAPVYWITDNPVLAANVTIVTIFILRALSMQILLRRYTGPEAAILGALFFAFSPTADEGTVKFYLLATFGLVLSFALVDRLLALPRVRDVLGLALLLSVQAATSVYLAFASMLGMLAWTFSLLCSRWRQIDPQRMVGLLVAAGLAALILVPLHIPYLRLVDGSDLPDYLRGAGSNWTMLERLNSFRIRRFATESIPAVVWVCAALAFFPRRRMPLAPIGGAALVGLIGLVFSLGPYGRFFGVPTGSIYVFFSDLVPGMSTVRVPSRFLVLCQIAVSVLAGLGVHAILSGLGRWPRRVVAILVGALYLGHFAPQSQPMRLVERGHMQGHVYEALATLDDGRAVLELPSVGWAEAADRMMGSTTHWHPIVDGYSGHSPESDDLIHFAAQDLPAKEALGRLVDTVDVGWIVVHGDELLPRDRRKWRRGDLPGLTKIGTFGQSDLYRVEWMGDPERQGLMSSRALTMDGNSREALGNSCPGEIELRSIRYLRGRGNTLYIRLRLRNFGSRAWPGLGAYTNGLVRLGICVEPAESCVGKGVRLVGDVPAGGALDQNFSWVIPRRRGAKKLRIELFQQGGPSLDTCGVEPLVVDLPEKPRKSQRPSGKKKAR